MKAPSPCAPHCHLQVRPLGRLCAIDGAVVVRKMITLTATIDHRFMDGYQGGILAKTVREMFESPWKLDGLQAPPPEVAARLAE